MSKINIALAQLACEDGQVEKNLQVMDKVIKEYGNTHEIILFPETYTIGFPSREVARKLAEPLNGPIMKHIERQAREANTSIVVGLYERDGDNVYNTSVLVSPKGLQLSYRKTHLFMEEAEKLEKGNYFRSCQWGDTRVGLLICYDCEFPETARSVAGLGTELILLTNGNMEPYGPVHRIAIQARALENQVFMAMANRVGVGGKYNFVGESIIVNPYGEIVVAAGNDEEVISAKIDTSIVQESRKDYYYLNERRLFPIGAHEIGPGVWETKF